MADVFGLECGLKVGGIIDVGTLPLSDNLEALCEAYDLTLRIGGVYTGYRLYQPDFGSRYELSDIAVCAHLGWEEVIYIAAAFGLHAL